MISENISLFITVAGLHLFAVMSPGPDFALILRQAFNYGRKISIITSIGIGVGILFHVFYCIAGLSLIITKSSTLFKILEICGGVYLILLGYKSIKSDANTDFSNSNSKSKKNMSHISAFLMGFITNILNPKATLFFLSLYTYIISVQTNQSLYIFYGLWMSIVTAMWFFFVSIFLTNKFILKKMNNFLYILKYGTSILLVIVGLQLLY